MAPVSAMAALRDGDAAATPNDPMTREFAVGPGPNLAMRAVLRLEHRLRRAGLRSPLGGSRVMVAQKLPGARNKIRAKKLGNTVE